MPIEGLSFHPMTTSSVKDQTVRVKHGGRSISATVQITRFNQNIHTKQVGNVVAGIIMVNRDKKEHFKTPRPVLPGMKGVQEIGWRLAAGNGASATATLVIYYWDK